MKIETEGPKVGACLHIDRQTTCQPCGYEQGEYRADWFRGGIYLEDLFWMSLFLIGSSETVSYPSH